MIKVKWELEEAVALVNLYFENGKSTDVPLERLKALSQLYAKRANALQLAIDDKFRNVAGLKIQLACIHYVVTNGNEGMSNASKLFYQTCDLYWEDPDRFNKILRSFYEKYDT